MSNKLKYRPYETRDIKSIIGLWEHHSGFGGIDEKTFEDWYVKTPYEPAEIIVAEDEENKVRAQMVFMPTRIRVGEQVIKGMRIAAPIIDRDIRFSDTDFLAHPLFNLFMNGMLQSKRKGFALVYIFPARGWLTVLDKFSHLVNNWLTASFPTFSIEVGSTIINPTGSPGFFYKEAEAFTEQYDELWEKAIRDLPIICGIEKKKDWLTFRLSQHIIIEARDKDNGELKGYCVINRKSGMIIDLLATSQSDLKEILFGTLDTLVQMNKQEVVMEGKLTGMYTDLMAKILEGEHIEFPDYKIDFGCTLLDKNISAESIKLSNWYMMPDL